MDGTGTAAMVTRASSGTGEAALLRRKGAGLLRREGSTLLPAAGRVDRVELPEEMESPRDVG